MSSVKFGIATAAFFLSIASFGGEGHDHGAEKNETNPTGYFSVNGVIFHDLGESLFLGPYKLSKSAHKELGIHYHESRPVSVLNALAAGPWNFEVLEGALAQKVSGSGVINFEKATLQVNAPVLNADGSFTVLWTSGAAKSDRAQVVLETLGAGNEITGRIIFDTMNTGTASIPSEVMLKLPKGRARVALKTIKATPIEVHGTKSAFTVLSVTSQVMDFAL